MPIISDQTRQEITKEASARIMELEDKLEDMTWNYNEAMRQYDVQQKRACEAEAKLTNLLTRLAALITEKEDS